MHDVAKRSEPFVDATSAPGFPKAVERTIFQAELESLLVREKAHTREGDAIAAARRRLPVVEVDPSIPLIGANGPVRLIDVFEGRLQLMTYFHMWHIGKPAAEQCEGCTFNTSQVRELAYLHSRNVTYATFCEGPYEESSRYRDFMGWQMPWYSAQGSADALLAGRDFGMLVCYLRDGERVFETYWTTGRGNEVMGNSLLMLDRTIYGRQEPWEDSPKDWPQPFGEGEPMSHQFRLDGRPIAQWPRLSVGQSDDLGSSGH